MLGIVDREVVELDAELVSAGSALSDLVKLSEALEEAELVEMRIEIDVPRRVANE